MKPRLGCGFIRGCRHASGWEPGGPMPVVGVSFYTAWVARGEWRVRNHRFYFRKIPWRGPSEE